LNDIIPLLIGILLYRKYLIIINEKWDKMKNNSELQKDVQDSIKYGPLLNAADIGATVKDGVVTLTGTVDNYSKHK